MLAPSSKVFLFLFEELVDIILDDSSIADVDVPSWPAFGSNTVPDDTILVMMLVQMDLLVERSNNWINLGPGSARKAKLL